MKIFISLLLVTLQVIVIVSAETVQLESSQGILIPAPIAHSVRVARASYAPSNPASSAYAPSSYAAPALGPAPSSYSAPAPAPVAVSSYSAPAPSSYSSPAAPVHHSGSSSRSIPAPPCPRNYLFSCQPSLTPVPCAASAPAPSGGGSYSSPQGAYSQFVPQYAVPVVRELY